MYWPVVSQVLIPLHLREHCPATQEVLWFEDPLVVGHDSNFGLGKGHQATHWLAQGSVLVHQVERREGPHTLAAPQVFGHSLVQPKVGCPLVEPSSGCTTRLAIPPR
ncbi:uncharacterized protein METZ01_LOCUS302840, partial [marine metagenome]